MKKSFVITAAIFNIYLVLATMPTNAWAAETTLKAICPEIQQSTRTEFHELTTLALYVEIKQNKYEHALKCFGIEEICAQKEASHERSDDFYKKYAENLKNTNSLYHRPIQLKNIEKIYNERLEQEVLPFIKLGPDCKKPAVQILNSSNVSDIVDSPGTFTLIVTLDIIDDTSPPIAVITSKAYRSEVLRQSFNSRNHYMNGLTAIPLDISDEAISKRLNEFSRVITLLNLNPALR